MTLKGLIYTFIIVSNEIIDRLCLKTEITPILHASPHPKHIILGTVQTPLATTICKSF